MSPDQIADDDRGAVWSCKIGRASFTKMPLWADGPMRTAIANAYKELTGEEPDFIFSGWGAQLDELEEGVLAAHIDGSTDG